MYTKLLPNHGSIFHRWIFMEMLESRQWNEASRFSALMCVHALQKFHAFTAAHVCCSAASFESEAYTGRYQNS